MAAVVLVHGGGFAASCWDLVLDCLNGPVLAVDLPGRGIHPAPLETVTIAGWGASLVADVDEAGFDDIVLVGHSLAGCTMPSAIGLLGARVRHAVFVACTVPEDGTSCFDTLPSDVQAMARGANEQAGAGVLGSDAARAMFGNDLDDTQFAWCLERMVPEASGPLFEPVDLSPFARPFPRTWIRPLRDAIVGPEKQLRFAGNVGACELVDLDAGHMCMISKPAELAGIISAIAENASRTSRSRCDHRRRRRSRQ